ncbi:hypothetical protein [Nocardia tengchongensis]|uniref:hypothetical protein n=1 Tax=Nocardia tengchongensis TaxID=2055889 RepID=UPI00364955B1
MSAAAQFQTATYSRATGEGPLTPRRAGEWEWLSQLYSHPVWGLSAAVPRFTSQLSTAVAELCRDMPNPQDKALAAEQWRLMRKLAEHGCARADDAALWHAWNTLCLTALQADDDLHQRRLGPSKALQAALLALRASTPPHAAGLRMQQALDAWTAHSSEESQ